MKQSVLCLLVILVTIIYVEANFVGNKRAYSYVKPNIDIDFNVNSTFGRLFRAYNRDVNVCRRNGHRQSRRDKQERPGRGSRSRWSERHRVAVTRNCGSVTMRPPYRKAKKRDHDVKVRRRNRHRQRANRDRRRHHDRRDDDSLESRSQESRRHKQGRPGRGSRSRWSERHRGKTFKYASYYSNSMVLQRAPARATVWGYAFTTGDSINVTITNDGTGESAEYSTTAVDGQAGLPTWTVSMDPVDEGGPYTISVSSVDCVLTLTDVLFGDIWLCSGQSNMEHIMNNIDDPVPDLEDTVNYPNIRTFITGRNYIGTPQEDLISVGRTWAIPDASNIGGFSAVCWLFATHLYNKYQRPIGLIESDWGGTRIEAWSSPAALQVCFPDGALPGTDANEASALYNAMIYPFIPFPIYGAIWYQGESNQNNAADYGCAIREMVNDWRSTWVSATDTMDPQFPFGEVQLAPNTDNDAQTGFTDVRWHQTFEFGYVPNDQLQRFFMAVATDLPDFYSPHGSIHPRYKRQIAQRLSLGAINVAYGDASSGTHQGPLPSGIALGGNNDIAITMGDGTAELEQRGDPSTQNGYEICCSADATVFCGGANTRWVAAGINYIAVGSVNIAMTCEAGEFVTGIRYTWRESPCRVIEKCPLYAAASGNSLPAPPFIYNGLIA